jgi:peptide/nickel transport system substrate-binding protein/oligopeptide transport system substrate-binding protein
MKKHQRKEGGKTMKRTPGLKWLCACALALATMPLWLCDSRAASASSAQRHGGDYRVPLASEPISLDPAFITDIYSVNVAMNLYDGLVEFDKDLNVVPAIARVWKISRDHLTYTFFLRRGVRFHNGREVTAKDFIFSFSRILSPDTRSPVASFFLNIEGAGAYNAGKAHTVTGLISPDPYTLEIKLEQPFAPFLSILAMANAKVVPLEAMGASFIKYPVGTGPFCFKSWKPGREIVLTANENYYGGRPFLDSLRFRIYPNIEWERIFEDFEKGLLDQSIIPSSEYDVITSDALYTQKYKFVSKPTLNLVYVGMNVTVAPFHDARVRRAICYALNTPKIVADITKRGSVPAKGVLPPGVAGFNPELRGYSYDVERARDLLKEAGYPGGEGIPPVEIWTVSKSESVQKELQAYQRYLEEIGIELVPKVAKNWADFVKRINEKKAPMYYAAWYADYPDPDNFLYVLFHSRSKTNRMGYRNAEVDELLEKARRETDYMARVQLYREIEKVVLREAPVVCQHVNSFSYLFQPWVKGVEVSFLGAAYIPFSRVWLESAEHRQARIF